jgi:Ca-activated chloride channel family protein
MNMNSFDQELQQMNAPVPDPAARLRARRAALAEFRNIHAQVVRQPAASKWSWKSPWLGGFATACVAVVGVSIFWLVPEEQRRIQLPATAPAATQAAPASTAAPQARMPEPPQASAGGSRALTLVDDRRVASSASQADLVDLNTVPSNLLQRMDVVTGGAAAGSDELSEVQITGTRIQAPGSYTSANPVTSITAEEMRQLGVVKVADALAQLPAAAAAAQAGGGAPGDRGAQFIGNTIANLRGMDPTFGSRTLTLVDGRRVVSSSNQADAVLPAPPEGGDRFERFETNAVKRVADEPESTFSIDVDTTSYSFARRVLNEGRLPAMDAVRVEEMINYFDYAWPAPTSRREPLRSTVAVSDSPWGAGKKLVHIGIKGFELPVRGKPDANLVFLLDVSGSMAPNDRLPLAISSMRLLLDSLKPTDTVAIVVYAGAAGLVLPPTPVRNREAIERALTSLHSGGSTAGAQGIQLAYQTAQLGFRKDGINRILLATDGDFNVGISNREELKGLVERERANGIYLSVLGFGRGNYRDEVAQALAQNGNGVAAYIDTLQEARKVLVEEASASLFTIASDVKIQVEFNPAAVAEYRLVGYETRALKREDFNNDKVDAGDVGSGHAVTAIYEITPVGSAAQLIDERRYAASEKPKVAAQGKANEYGFLKIRYKLPGESQSRLMEQPIRQDMGVPAAVRQDVAFSTAVAGFGQLLRGGRYTGTLSYDDVIRQAEAARGEDEFGYRAEFVQLARKARAVRSPMCDMIQELDARIVEERRQVAQQLQRFNEQHPEVLAARARVASTEATRAAEVARAASLGVACQASALF